MTRAMGISVFSSIFLVGALGISAEAPHAAAGQAAAGAPAASVTASPATQAAIRYFKVPLFGQLGTDVNPVALEVALNEAEQGQASYVVMLFDSPGGDPTAAAAMIRTLSSHPKVQSIAFVRRATGAAALLAASCDKLYMYNTGIWGTSSESDCEQVRLCMAELGQVAAAQRRNPRAITALVAWNSELYLDTVDGKSDVRTTWTATSRIVKQVESGFILTPQDMVSCQVADGLGATLADVRQGLRISDWVSCGDRGAEIVKSLRQAPKPVHVVIESKPSQESTSSDPDLDRDALLYKSRAEEQERAIEARAARQKRAIEADRVQRDQYYEDQRAREDRWRQDEQNRMDRARKRREMDQVGRSFR